ncbi:hypothetical protein APX70_04932 [Pseudomonas syringae pv. maculicola]|uniref:Uncharacterized protein n=1 Tax=Pseudomonas syringae pv. maculicola TaxID=59511 RepID=A0A3M2W968_PSEYM|nr:hypothetical protein APX70_04932 [Pseudomonas syringae pv. maculicola]
MPGESEMKKAPLINTLNVNISVEGLSPVAACLVRGFLASGATPSIPKGCAM